MSGYGSPSLVKMEASSRRGRRPKKTFSPSRILGDPFALATISISILAWLIAFVSGVVSKINDYDKHPFPNFAWWTVAFYLLCIIGVIICIAFDTTFNYSGAITAFLAYALFLSTSAIDNTIWDPYGAHEAAAAGFILLSVVAVIWIFYFGSQPSSAHRGFIDSFALHGSNQGTANGSMRASNNNHFAQTNPPYATTQTYPRSQLGGLEASSPEPRYPDPPGTTSRQSPALQQRGFGGPTSPNGYGLSQKPTATETKRDSAEPANTEYPYKARAIYSYEANPEDANEISFQKHEILDVSDVSGRWWQAKKSNAETGIAPSNYLVLL